MPILKDIQWKALVLLTVFTANLYAVCQCHHKAIARPIAKSCCASKHTQQKDPGCPDKNGCTNGQSIKFSLLDKQTVEKIAIDAAPFLAKPVMTIRVAYSSVLPDVFIIQPHWRSGYAPPNLHSLYQRFLI